MIRRLLLPLLLVSAAFGAEGSGTAPAAPADPIAAVRARCDYTAAEFAVSVRPPVSFGKDVLVERIEFPSPVKSRDPERNDVVRAKLFRTERPEPAAVVCLGGWRFDPVTPQLAARLAAETGIQALYVDLPFQGERTPAGRAPGDLTLSADVDQNVETFVQAALDVARAADWLVRERKVDPGRIGLLGTSLGGFVSADLYGMTDRYSCAVVQLAGADVAASIFNGNRITRQLRDAFVAAGLDEPTVRERMRPLAPLTWSRKERREGLLLIAAERDDVVPLASVKALAEAYGGAETVVMPGAGHISPDALKEHFARAIAHVRARLGVPEPKAEPVAPATPEPVGK